MLQGTKSVQQQCTKCARVHGTPGPDRSAVNSGQPSSVMFVRGIAHGNCGVLTLNWLVLPHYVYEVRVLGGGSVYPPYFFCHIVPTKQPANQISVSFPFPSASAAAGARTDCLCGSPVPKFPLGAIIRFRPRMLLLAHRGAEMHRVMGSSSPKERRPSVSQEDHCSMNAL